MTNVFLSNTNLMKMFSQHLIYNWIDESIALIINY